MADANKRYTKPELFKMPMGEVATLASKLNIAWDKNTDKKVLIDTIMTEQSNRELNGSNEAAPDTLTQAERDLMGNPVEDTNEAPVDGIDNMPENVRKAFVKALGIDMLQSQIASLVQDRDNRVKALEKKVATLEGMVRAGKSTHGSIDNLGHIDNLKHGKIG